MKTPLVGYSSDLLTSEVNEFKRWWLVGQWLETGTNMFSYLGVFGHFGALIGGLEPQMCGVTSLDVDEIG